MHADVPSGQSTGGREVRSRILERSLLLALVLTVPVLCLAQETGSTVPSASAPATGGVPAAELPGASLPGAAVPIPGLTGAAATGLNPVPSEYTSYGASVGVGGTDNVNLSATDPKAQAMAATNLFLNLLRTGSRLELSALGNFSDIDYLEHAYGNQVLGRFDGLANLTLWQHHLKWLVRDDYGNTEIDPLQSLTPNNLQRMNVFSTGPDLILQPTAASFVELQGIYSRSSFQEQSAFNGQSEMGSASVGHQFSPSSSIALVGQVQQERFDNTLVNSDYQIREYYGRYRLQGARTSIDAQAGLAQDNGTGSWTSSPLVRLSITRNVSAFSTISLSGGRDYTNAMSGFANLGSASGGIPIGAATQTTANAVQTFGNASWGFHRLRTTINLIGGWERNAYGGQQSVYDVSRTDVGLNVSRQLTPRLSANILASMNRGSYGNQGFTQNFGTAGAGLVYRPGKWIVIYGNYNHQFLHASGVTRGLGYDENRIYVMVGYYPHSTGTGAPGRGGMGGMGGRLP